MKEKGRRITIEEAKNLMRFFSKQENTERKKTEDELQRIKEKRERMRVSMLEKLKRLREEEERKIEEYKKNKEAEKQLKARQRITEGRKTQKFFDEEILNKDCLLREIAASYTNNYQFQFREETEMPKEYRKEILEKDKARLNAIRKHKQKKGVNDK